MFMLLGTFTGHLTSRQQWFAAACTLNLCGISRSDTAECSNLLRLLITRSRALGASVQCGAEVVGSQAVVVCNAFIFACWTLSPRS